MIPQIKYDFSEFERILFQMKSNTSSHLMSELRDELNSFFKDSRCKEVIYTNNTDKMFFGMAVMPNIKTDDVYDILQSDQPYRISEYYLELDSKLFSPMLGLSAREITAILLHEVGHIVKDTAPMEAVRNNIDVYLMKNNETIAVSDSIHYKEILSAGIKDALRKITSIFENNDDEVVADEFVVMCGYGPDLESGFHKIIRNSYNINKDVDNKIIVLAWVLRLYKDVKLKRISAIRSMQKSKTLTASKLERKEMENIIQRLNRLDDDSLNEAFGEDLQARYSATIKQIKYKGIASLEDDVYEYQLRVNNIDTESDALILLHQMNAKMAIIDDYVSTEKMTEREQKRWFLLQGKYQKLRDELSKKATYRTKNRLYVSYPDTIQDVSH